MLQIFKTLAVQILTHLKFRRNKLLTYNVYYKTRYKYIHTIKITCIGVQICYLWPQHKCNVNVLKE